MYTPYRSPAAFYECLITVVIALLRTTTAPKIFSLLPPAKPPVNLETVQAPFFEAIAHYILVFRESAH